MSAAGARGVEVEAEAGEGVDLARRAACRPSTFVRRVRGRATEGRPSASRSQRRVQLAGRARSRAARGRRRRGSGARVERAVAGTARPRRHSDASVDGDDLDQRAGASERRRRQRDAARRRRRAPAPSPSAMRLAAGVAHLEAHGAARRTRPSRSPALPSPSRSADELGAMPVSRDAARGRARSDQRGARAAARSALAPPLPSAWNPMRLCVPSQYGLFVEPPQRHSETARPSSIDDRVALRIGDRRSVPSRDTDRSE